MTLKMVPKPEGHDLAIKRAFKYCDASKWLPENTLYDLSEQLSKNPLVGALICAWYQTNERGELGVRITQWNESSTYTIALASELLHVLMVHR